jgi:hypothetical protein
VDSYWAIADEAIAHLKKTNEKKFYYYNRGTVQLLIYSSANSYLYCALTHKPCNQIWNRGEHGWIGNYAFKGFFFNGK